jgi:Fe-S-cluster containining protein
MFKILQELREAADARAGAITARYPDWPCRKGCDHCCRSLARMPDISEIEWREVEAGLALLPAAARAEIDARMGAVSRTCAFLDPLQGDCLIYEHRPIACRTYGFYVDERGIGLHCGMIEASQYPEAVWGNHSAVDARLEELGPTKSTVQWSSTPPCTRS